MNFHLKALCGLWHVISYRAVIVGYQHKGNIVFPERDKKTYNMWKSDMIDTKQRISYTLSH